MRSGMFRVMVVDDERLVRQGITDNTEWARIGCQLVAEAGNGLEGIKTALEAEPDLIISDIRMPGMNGLEMMEEIRKHLPEVRVIFLTAYSDFSYAQQAIRLGAGDYVLKPFEDGVLEKAIERVLSAAEEENFREISSGDDELNLSIALKSKGECENRYVAMAISYIAAHFQEAGLGVKEIAEHLNVSEGHIMRLFKKETDISMAAYITRYRMRVAMHLLGDVKHRVYEVAAMVGYQDISYFSSTFKKIVGVSPSEYQSSVG